MCSSPDDLLIVVIKRLMPIQFDNIEDNNVAMFINDNLPQNVNSVLIDGYMN